MFHFYQVETNTIIYICSKVSRGLNDNRHPAIDYLEQVELTLQRWHLVDGCPQFAAQAFVLLRAGTTSRSPIMHIC